MNFQRGMNLSMLLFLLILPATGFASQDQQQEDLVAKVGKISITQQELDRELNRLIPMNTSFHGGVKPETLQKMKDEALQNLIDRAYKVQFAIDEEMAVDPQELESKWQEFKTKNAKALSNVSNDVITKLRADQYRDLLAAKAEQEAVEDKVQINEEMVKEYYQENKSRYVKPKTFTASHIFVRVGPSDPIEVKEEKKKRADELYARAQSGEDFYNLAYYESDDRTKYVGGSLGSFHAGQTVAEFDQAIQKMQPGEISEPIKTIYGYHIIRLDNLEEERQLPYEEAAVSIRETMKKKLRDELYNAWMNDLKQKYPVQQFHDTQ